MDNQARGRILLVDDEEQARHVTSKFLREQQGYEVDACRNAQEAIEALKKQKPDLVISDIRMPGMDGLSLLRFIKEHDPLIEVVMITGFASVHTAIEAMKKGADDFIMKPVDLGHLALIAEKCFEKKNLALEIRAKQDEIKELEELNRRLQEVNKLKDDFIGLVSHELNTPVAFIHESVSLLKDASLKLTDQERKTMLDNLDKHCAHLKRFVKNLLDISVISKSILEKEKTDVREILDEALAEAEHYYSKKNVTLNFQRPQQPVIAEVDRNRIVEALYHLLANAIKFNKENGQVNVSVASEDDKVMIKVQDTGIGIEEKEKDRIFERFYQVDHGATRSCGGAGVGLPLVKKYVELHNGSVEVESKPGGGSTFLITLPAQDN